MPERNYISLKRRLLRLIAMLQDLTRFNIDIPGHDNTMTRPIYDTAPEPSAF